MGLQEAGPCPRARQEDRFWEDTLGSPASHFGEPAEVDTQVVCIDKKRQWRHARNIWHSAAIRSSLYVMSAAFRFFKRRRAAAG